MGTTLMDRHSADSRLYRRLRTMGVRPPQAVWFVKYDARLRTAEFNDEITLNRVYDDDYTVEPGWSKSDNPDLIAEMQRWADEEGEKLNSGEWVAWGIIAKRNVEAECRLCRTPYREQHRDMYNSDNPTEAAVWGVVVDNGPEGEYYLRQVEIDLAFELGVIE